MKKIFYALLRPTPSAKTLDLSLLAFRIIVSLELIAVHGLKKLGVGVANAEVIPNPLHFPEAFNNAFATAANLVFPLFVIAGLFTRMAVIPILAVTLTGYFIVHANGTLLEKDTPFIYSIAFLMILATGPGKYSIDYLINKKAGS